MSTNPNAKLHSAGMNFTPTIHNDTYPFIAPSQFDLRGRAVFITGASKGVGRAMAISYAQAGASYIGLGARSDLSGTKKAVLEAAERAQRPAPNVLALDMDVTSEDSVATAVRKLKRAFDRLDILVNNAGALEPWVPLTQSAPDAWWNSFEVSIRGTYLVSRALVPLLLRQPSEEDATSLRTVINVSSYGAHFTMKGASAYQTSKFALLRLTEFLASDYEHAGLLAISIHPGGVATELALGMPEWMHGNLKDTPELAGDATVWLTAERREWLNRRFVSLTWDFEELLGKRESIEEGDLLKVRMDVGLE